MFHKYKTIHLIGIGGINVSAIAKLLLSQGKIVSGFDLVKSEITDELIQLKADISTENAGKLSESVDFVIYSEAVPEDDPQRVEAKSRGIKQISAFQFWGEYAKNKKVIAVSGTNGKSSTTALIGRALEKNNFDPTVVVGTKVLEWNSNIRLGKSEWLVIEADEYHAHMLEFKPYIAVITNISPDHLDYYKDIDDIVNHFQKWVDSIPKDGFLILNRDDQASKRLNLNCNIKKFGVNGSQEIRSAGVTTKPEYNGNKGILRFNIVDDLIDWGEVWAPSPGKHTISNIVAAATAACALGIDKRKIVRSLRDFQGTWRRFEFIGEYNGAVIISDYAHHPDGIRTTLEAAREWYPFKRIILLYQPHQHNRTKNLFDDFVTAFSEADELILAEIYDVAGREEGEDQSISSKDLVKSITRPNADYVTYAPDLESAEQILKDKIKPEDIVIIMGAGDVDNVARKLIKN